MIDGYEGAIKYYNRGFFGFSPQWVTLGYIGSNEWHHMKIDFNYLLEKLSIYIDGNLGIQDGYFSLAPNWLTSGSKFVYSGKFGALYQRFLPVSERLSKPKGVESRRDFGNS